MSYKNWWSVLRPSLSKFNVIKFLQLIKNRFVLASALSLSLTAASFGATLGPNLRSAVLGQPLDLSMQLMLDVGDDPSDLCLNADVFYVDKPLDKSLVRLSAEKSGTTQERLIHVRSAVPVEGPVVTVLMRAGCVQKSTRRYVVLAVARSRANSLTGDKTSSAATGDGAPSDEKIRALEVELRQMREEALKNQALLAQRNVRLEKATHDRYDKALVYGLAATLAAAIVGFFYLSYRRSIAPVVSTGGTLNTGFGPHTGNEVATGFGSPTGFGIQSERGVISAPIATARARSTADAKESKFDGLKRASRHQPSDSIAPLSARDRPRFHVSVPFVSRTVKVPELLALQQQVELLISSGKQEQAIALLRRHLVDNVKTSALVYLDLLNLYHQTGRETDFEDLRDDFNHVFKTHVAPFQSFGGEAAATAAYEAVLLRVQAVWPTRHVFHVLEDALFREPGNPAEVLILDEYRELLLLHAVGREILDLEAGPSGVGLDSRSTDLAMQPKSSPRLGLDIDLSQLSVGDTQSFKSVPEAVQGASASGRALRPGLDMSQPQSRQADLSHSTKRTESVRAGAVSISAPVVVMPTTTQRPASLDSLVDFDDHDTGLRPEDLSRPGRL